MDQHTGRNPWIAPQLRSLSASRAAAGDSNRFATEGGHLIYYALGKNASENVGPTFKGLATTGAAPS
jgi:hypothetical protein